MPTAAIYTRVSTDEQARRGVSLDAQREQCIAYCQQVGLVVARVEVFPGRLVVRHPEDLLPPMELELPRYYRPPKAK